MADKTDDQGFLQRWSARKLDANNAPEDDAPEDDAVTSEPEPEPEGEADAQPPADLPDVETLDAQSDYTGFLGDNVPQDLTNLAMRKLWRSDPVLANLDGLNDYDDDFSQVGTASEVVKTLYKVGKGLLAADDETHDNADEPSEDEPDNGDGEAKKNVALSSENESDVAEFHNAELNERD